MSKLKWPPQVKYIIGNEGCERYSFYGMRAILTVFMTQYLMMKADVSTEVMHAFIGASYFLPLLGAYVADRFMGRYYTILYFSLFYCAGHATLAMFENQTGLFVGLGLIAFGAGSIKPCVSSFVGDQFKKGQEDLITKVYNIFYFSINFGSTISSLLTPLTLKWFGPSVAFGIPGILMAIATLVFWMGRKHYVMMPPTGPDKDNFWSVLGTGIAGNLPFWLRLVIGAAVVYCWQYIWLPFSFSSLTWSQQAMEIFALTVYAGMTWAAILIAINLVSGQFMKSVRAKHAALRVEEFTAVLNVIKIFGAVSVFWSLFDQSASTWVLMAVKMKQHVNFFGFEFDVLPSQMQAANPILVLIMIPVFVKWIYPTIDRFYKLTPLRKMTIGMFSSAVAYSTVALIQYPIDAGGEMHILWQLVPYLLMTMSEVMVSIVGLEFAYTQAPKAVKSTVMSFWLLTVSVGSLITIIVVQVNPFPIASGHYFMIFSVMAALTACLFGTLARFYKPRNYLN